jgi:ATP-dependent DNA helicase RecQ
MYQHSALQNSYQPVQNNTESAAHTSEKIPSYIQTLALFQQGKTLEEITILRKLSITTVQNHFIRCQEEGHTIPWETLIPPGQEELILEAINKVGGERLRPIKDALPEDVDWLAIKVVLAKYKASMSNK